MGMDATGGMQTPSPMQQNTARGMDPMQGAVGAGGPAKGGMVTPAQPDFPVRADNPAVAPGPASAGGVDQLKMLIARLLQRGGK